MNIQSLIEAINFRGVVTGLTHDFYRYPARFSPHFARAAIGLFTEPGDTVLDPFSGSSTSLVEALANGRNAVGTDINQLAIFLAKVKTLLLDNNKINMLRDWAEVTVPDLSPRKPVVRHTDWMEAGYQVNMPWRFRKIAEQAINNAEILLTGDALLAARCVVLKTVQWAVDCKKFLPSAADFREKIVEDTGIIADGLKALRLRVESLGKKPTTVEVHNCAADQVASTNSDLLRRRPPKLVVTSPPYPGVHVLYHRWQVLGRRETPAPYWITGCEDGQGSAYYTFGDRRSQDHDEVYFQRLQRCFTEVRKVVRDDCVVVQLVGFARPDDHLPLYLDAMRAAGFEEFNFETAGHHPRQKQFWRAVPNRKWYTWLRDDRTQSKEVLLVHRARG
jgi:DNA modification methylase